MDESTLLDALEIGSMALPAVPNQAWFLDVPGVLARETVIPHPFLNLVSVARLSESEADATIARLVAHFDERRKPFGWMVGPRSTPSDLRTRLVRAGLKPLQEIQALACEDLALPIPVPSDVLVRAATVDDRDVFDAIKAETFGMPLESARRIDDLVFGLKSETVRADLAFADGRAVGFAQTFWRGRVAILGGAGVVENFRGRGVFRALVAKRFADARSAGLSAATIQAYENTSAPILSRLGFRLLGTMTLFARGG